VIAGQKTLALDALAIPELWNHAYAGPEMAESITLRTTAHVGVGLPRFAIAKQGIQQ
jgi:hypothetical protein